MLVTYSVLTHFLTSNQHLNTCCTTSPSWWQWKDMLCSRWSGNHLRNNRENPSWLLVHVCAENSDGWYQIQDRISLIFPVDVLVSSCPGAYSTSLSRKHKENRQRWRAREELMLHVDVWARFSSYGCQKLRLERESAPTSSHCTTVNKQTEVWDCAAHTLKPGMFLWSNISIPLCLWRHDLLLMQTALLASLPCIITKPWARRSFIMYMECTYCTAEATLRCKNMHLQIIKSITRQPFPLTSALNALQTPLLAQ